MKRMKARCYNCWKHRVRGVSMGLAGRVKVVGGAVTMGLSYMGSEEPGG